MKNHAHSSFIPFCCNSVKIIPFFLLFLSPASHAQTIIKATGTGRTTGHIADLMIENTTAAPLRINHQLVYIPSGGQYQPYIAEIPETVVPKGTSTIPVEGYCADVHQPPVPSGDPMPHPEEWIPVGNPEEPIPEGTIDILPKPEIPSFNPEDIPGISTSSGYTPVNPNPSDEFIPTWPGTDIPVGGTLSPVEPEVYAPVIARVYEVIKEATIRTQEEDILVTPFSPDPLKERDAVIQQTFWIFTSYLSGRDYKKEDFTENVYEQFNSATGILITKIPEEQKEEVDKGIDQFWSVFTAVGVEAKVLSDKKDMDEVPVDNPEDVLINNETFSKPVTITDSLSRQERYKNELKNCFFERLQYSIQISHIYTEGTGKKAKQKIKGYFPDDKNVVEIKLGLKDTIVIDIIDPSCSCLCYTAMDPKTKVKSGSFCECSIDGIHQTSYNAKAFTDFLDGIFDKAVLDSLKKEVTKKLDDLEKAKGKKTEIDKLKKQLADNKKLQKDNAARFAELKKAMEGKWRTTNDYGISGFVVKTGFNGQVEFDFEVKGKCKGDAVCKGAEFTRTIKVFINVPR